MTVRLSTAWPARPRRLVHPDLGRLVRWQRRDRDDCRVDRYLDGTRRFLAQVRQGPAVWRLVSRHRTLRAAQRACERHVRDTTTGDGP